MNKHIRSMSIFFAILMFLVYGAEIAYGVELSNKEVTSIKLNHTEMDLGKGASITLKATVTPASSQETVTWISSNGKLATVSKGVIFAKDYGTVTITAKIGKSVSASCTVHIVPRKVAQKALSVSSNKVTLTWNAVSDALGHRIVYSKDGSEFTLLTDIKGGNIKSFTTNTLKDGTYLFKVRAYIKLNDKTNFGKYSDITRAKIGGRDADILQEISGEKFYFASGMGAWGTELTIKADGTFSGTFWDDDDGVRYLCEFTGKFTSVKKVSTYMYSMKLEKLTYKQPPGAVVYDDGIKIIYSDAYGVAGGDIFYLYLPGFAISSLPESFVSWMDWWPDTPTKLPHYGLYNINTESGFSTPYERGSY